MFHPMKIIPLCGERSGANWHHPGGSYTRKMEDGRCPPITHTHPNSFTSLCALANVGTQYVYTSDHKPCDSSGTQPLRFPPDLTSQWVTPSHARVTHGVTLAHPHLVDVDLIQKNVVVYILYPMKTKQSPSCALWSVKATHSKTLSLSLSTIILPFSWTLFAFVFLVKPATHIKI